ncbi:MAG: nuclear transport factor 2 family protein [Candidatus Rokuibacteriota bacterium]
MTDVRAEIEEANRRFYRAFETLDLAEMEKVWAHGDHVKCVHPGWPLLSGWDAVRASWEAILNNTGEIRFTVSEAQVVRHGDLGWVTCTENILSQVRGRVSVTTVLATNIFALADGGWLMVHHHASHVLGGTPES